MAPFHPHNILVNQQELESFIKSVKPLARYEPFLKARWLKMVMWWQDRSSHARRRYFLFRGIIIAVGASIPVLSTVEAITTLGMSVVIAGAGSVVAGCAAWEGVANYGEVWREKRRASELLKVEGWQFFQLCGKYSVFPNHETAFPHFATQVEAMIAKEVDEHLNAFGPFIEQAKQMGTTAQAKLFNEVVGDTVPQ